MPIYNKSLMLKLTKYTYIIYMLTFICKSPLKKDTYVVENNRFYIS